MILNILMLYINLYKPLFINCGVTVIEVASNAHLARLSMILKATYLIECPIPCTSMLEVVEMVT